mmetsp:Transcript_5229/g.10602  ORF Transcript_5229/g.10602 Transcript_5229/m.10602 type:complete len:135 (+) Transcript_5229:195-599(+)
MLPRRSGPHPVPRPIPSNAFPCPKSSDSALLFAAVIAGDLTILHAHSMCSLMRTRDHHGSSLLHYAAGSGHLPACHFLAGLTTSDPTAACSVAVSFGNGRMLQRSPLVGQVPFSNYRVCGILWWPAIWCVSSTW